jgi:hypothetical protein
MCALSDRGGLHNKRSSLVEVPLLDLEIMDLLSIGINLDTRLSSKLLQQAMVPSPTLAGG